MSDFRKLEVWEKSHALLLNVHGAVKSIRGADYASLRNQMLRSGMSVPTNLVEGVGQKSAKEFARFIRISGFEKSSGRCCFPIGNMESAARIRDSSWENRP